MVCQVGIRPGAVPVSLGRATSQLAQPYISESNRAIVPGEDERANRFVTAMPRENAMASFAVNLLVEVNQHTSVMHGDSRRCDPYVAVVFGRGEVDVVSLPLAEVAAGIHQRRCLGINRGCLAIGAPFDVVRIEDLNFIKTHQKNTIVALVVPWPFPIGWRHPFDVELDITESFLADEATGSGYQIAIFESPITEIPVGDVFAIEQDNRIGGDRCWGGCGTGINSRRRGPVWIVNQIAAPGQDGSVFIAENSRAVGGVNQSVGKRGQCGICREGKESREQKQK